MADHTELPALLKVASQDEYGESMENVALDNVELGEDNQPEQMPETTMTFEQMPDDDLPEKEDDHEQRQVPETAEAEQASEDVRQPPPEGYPPIPTTEPQDPPPSLPTSPPETPSIRLGTPPPQQQPSSLNGMRSPPVPSQPFSPRMRTDSSSTTATNTTPGAARNSLVFVVSALEHISASKDAQRRKDLKDAVQLALNEIKTKGDPQQIDPKLLFHPLRLSTEAQTESVVTTALDCIGKLISYSYFSTPTEGDAEGAVSLIDQAIDTICECFEGEGTADRIQLQIVISLLAAVLNDKVVVHGAGLLKSVRQMYNIFLHSKNNRTQQVAQASLSQMVNTVFERARKRVTAKEFRANQSKTSPTKEDAESDDQVEMTNGDVTSSASTVLGDADGEQETDDVVDEPVDVPVEKDAPNKMTLQTFEQRGSFDEDRLREGPTTVTKARGRRGTISLDKDLPVSEEDEEDETYMKDAFLVFRAMCKISIKSLRAEEVVDVRSQGMRAKLLSLHIVHTILFHNISLFLSPQATIRSNASTEATSFMQAVKQLLCQSLSRNGASSVNRVFEIGCEIFWMMLKNLRMVLKKEIEVFLKEIYLSILDNRTAPLFQKQCFLNTLERLAVEPRALVEIYLNYDCDRTASENMYQRITEHLSRICTIPITINSLQQHAYQVQQKKSNQIADWQLKGTMPPSLASTSTNMGETDYYPQEYAMKQQSLECIVDVLRSLVHWSQQGVISRTNGQLDSGKVSTDEIRGSVRGSSDARPSEALSASYTLGVDSPPPGTPLAEDDPMELEREKQMKTALIEAVKQFNFKPKRGIKVLIENGFIPDKQPESIARFLLSTDRLDKAALGEYLGEGDAENIAIMHHFVDLMDFKQSRFVDALRKFLQAFRLPGEGQKIDRFMLKFAERYIAGNPNAFANADTAYVLAYSVIMLNTDQHSVRVKGNRMTPEDFIKNNRGINDNADLPEEYLRGIYDEIAHNEIVLDTERQRAAAMGQAAQPPPASFAANIGQAFATVGRDLQREAYVQRSEEMANKTEQLFKSLLRAQKRGTAGDGVRFVPATSYKHVGPMFDVSWMSFLTALSGCAQDTENLETVKLCMDGLRLAVQIACLFDLENPRQAFIQSIARFTNLYNLADMKAKNVEALRVLLDVAHTEGNALKTSWRDILTCISQLDRFQLISEGVPMQSVPDVFKAQPASPKPGKASSSRKSLQVPDRSRTKSGVSVSFRQEVAEESRSASIMNGVDRIFTSTSQLSGDAIVHFVKALCQVSWQEIESSGQSQEPRTYSLQKLVEVSEYNMSRVRFEWTNIWQILGEHFNQVGCHANTKVVHFALNSLRQLSIRFLDKEELPGFKFQKDFLKPFEHIINNATVVQVKEIVLHSLVQMIQARGENIRSGWRTIFGAFAVAAKERFESIVTLAYENVLLIYNTRLGVVISQGAFPDLVVCLTDFSKNSRFQKKSLQAIETLKGTIPKMLKTPECPLSSPAPVGMTTEQKQTNRQTQEEQYWFPVLFAFHDVLMTGDDLEVRSRALNYLFETLIKYGKEFPPEFWDTIWRQLLYPIFMVMKSKPEMSKMVSHEELSVWLSTTMIQALRNMMTLFTHYFDALEYMLDRFLDLLALCICQENDTLARIGSNCLQTLILQNVNKFTEQHWSLIVTAFVDLFTRTEATSLFSAVTNPHNSNTNGSSRPTLSRSSTTENETDLTPATSRQSKPEPSRMNSNHSQSNGNTPLSPEEPPTPGPLEDYRPTSTSTHQAPIVVTAARRRFFNQIITKCVLQLLLIETVNELFSNDLVYAQIPSAELLRLMALLKRSYQFAKRFNDDIELRNRLFQEGFMKQPPNLLKQESGSASVYVNILFRMYHDDGAERRASRAQTEAALIPLCVDIIVSYLDLKEETQQRNIATWRPVVVDVIEGYAGLPQEGFEANAKVFAPLATQLMGREMGVELQGAVRGLVHRIFEVWYEMPELEVMQPDVTSPMSPRPGGSGAFTGNGRSRRASRASTRNSAGPM